MKDWDAPDGWRRRAGIEGTYQLVSPYSGDLHQVVEHAHGNCVREYSKVTQEWELGMREMPADGIFGFAREVEVCFRRANKPAVIRANCVKMPEVYQACIESQGRRLPQAMS